MNLPYMPITAKNPVPSLEARLVRATGPWLPFG